MNAMKLFTTCGIAAALTVGIAYAAPMQDSKKESKKEAAKEMAKEMAMVGKAAPAFTLKDSAGKDVSLADFKGKVVVLE